MSIYSSSLPINQAQVLFGVVKSTADPDSLNRVQVTLNATDKAVDLPWLRVLQPLASSGYGALFLPEKDDAVVILAGAGGPDNMIVLGCLYTGTRKAVTTEDGQSNIKQIVTRGGSEITLDDTTSSEKITIQTKEGKVSMIMDNAGGKCSIVGATEVNVSSKTKVVVTAPTVELTGATAVTISSDTSVTVGAPSVEISGDTSVSISGAAISLG